MTRPFLDLVDMLRTRAERHGDRTAFTFLKDGEDDIEQVTYAELERSAERISQALLELDDSGGPNHALLLCKPGESYISAYFGILFAGWTPVPVYPPSPSRKSKTLPRLLSILQDSQARAIVTTSDLQPLMDPILASVPSAGAPAFVVTDALDVNVDSPRREPRQRNEIALIQYTSGSIAEPKGVLVSHANLLDNVEQILRATGNVGENIRAVSWLPPYHDMGLIGAILCPLYAGGESILMTPIHFLSRPVRWLRAVSRHRGNVIVGPNFGYQLCTQKVTPEQRDELDLSSLELAWNGAEPIRAKVLQEFAEYFAPCGFKANAFYPCYGLAESTLFVTGGEPGASLVVSSFSARELAKGSASAAPPTDEDSTSLVSVGHARGEGEIQIVDPASLSPLRAGAVGEIWLRGPSVCRGYWRRPEQSEATFAARTASGEGPYLRTGDLGFVQDGNLYITGRLKDLIIVRGRNIYPQDIEQTCEEAHASVRLGGCAAFAVDSEGEERLVLAVEVEPERGNKSASVASEIARLDKLVEALRRAVSNRHYIAAHDVVLLKAGTIPKTSSGKIQRHATRAGYVAGTLTGAYASVGAQSASAAHGS
ncbi:MAG: fatty acyl-AMP ligase [Pseudomonadota bacterium]